MLMEQIDTVLFDLDDTLVRYRRSPGEVLQVSFEIIGLTPLFTVEEYYKRFDEFAQQCDSMQELRSECFATLAAENGYEADQGRKVAKIFDSERDQTDVEPYPEAVNVLNTLRKDYQLGIVTNGANEAQQQKIDGAGIRKFFDSITVAGRDIPPKPASEPFVRAINSLTTEPDTTVHVGDSLEADIGGATAVGLHSVWVSESNDTQEYDPTYQIDSIGNLLSLPWAK